MSRSIGDAFKAAAAKDKKEKERLERLFAGTDYWSEALEFFNGHVKDGLARIEQSSWWNNVQYGLPPSLLETVPHYWMAGYFYLLESDMRKVLEWKHTHHQQFTHVVTPKHSGTKGYPVQEYDVTMLENLVWKF